MALAFAVIKHSAERFGGEIESDKGERRYGLPEEKHQIEEIAGIEIFFHRQIFKDAPQDESQDKIRDDDALAFGIGKPGQDYGDDDKSDAERNIKGEELAVKGYEENKHESCRQEIFPDGVAVIMRATMKLLSEPLVVVPFV